MDTNGITDAVKRLIESVSYGEEKAAVLDAVAGWGKLPRAFLGEAACLNSLIELGVDNPQALDNVLALVERKRGVVPPQPAEKERGTKTDYQRDYMAARRARLRKAIKIDEVLGDKELAGADRKAREVAIWAGWMAERDKRVQAQPEATWQERNKIVSAFWEEIDNGLERDLAEAERMAAHPPVSRRKVVKPEPKTTFGKKLASAVRK